MPFSSHFQPDHKVYLAFDDLKESCLMVVGEDADLGNCWELDIEPDIEPLLSG